MTITAGGALRPSAGLAKTQTANRATTGTAKTTAAPRAADAGPGNKNGGAARPENGTALRYGKAAQSSRIRQAKGKAKQKLRNPKPPQTPEQKANTQKEIERISRFIVDTFAKQFLPTGPQGIAKPPAIPPAR